MTFSREQHHPTAQATRLSPIIIRLAGLQTLARHRLSLLLKCAFAKNRDDFFSYDFSPLGALMDRFGFRGWKIALVLEAPDDAGCIAGFFGWRTGIFRCCAHKR